MNEIQKAIDGLDLACHPDYVDSRFTNTFLQVLKAGARFKASSTYSTGVGRYWEVECEQLPGTALIYAKSDHDSPGEDAKSDCKKLNALLSSLSEKNS